MRRLRYRHELTELEICDTLAMPAEFGATCAALEIVSGVLELLGSAVLGVVKLVVFAVGLTVQLAVPILGELICVALAAAGLVGRGLDHVGRAAARRSWVISAGMDALAQLPQSRRVERLPNNRHAIAVRSVR